VKIVPRERKLTDGYCMRLIDRFSESVSLPPWPPFPNHDKDTSWTAKKMKTNTAIQRTRGTTPLSRLTQGRVEDPAETAEDDDPERRCGAIQETPQDR
jgi:hypothetical protein